VAAPWRTGVLVFDATPLRDAVQRLDRYVGAAVTVDERVATLPVSGQLRIAQAHDWLQALPAVLPVRVQRRAGNTDGHVAAVWHVGPP
jgi:ferric-dicitrate binding protein FerR (iron transport regulator)